jgi:hypothetical protein
MMDSNLLKKIQEGKASSEDIMLYFSRQLKNIISHAVEFSGTSQSTIKFMEKLYLISDIEKATVIFRKLSNGEEVNKQDLDFYKELNKDLYTQYQAQW